MHAAFEWEMNVGGEGKQDGTGCRCFGGPPGLSQGSLDWCGKAPGNVNMQH